MSQYHPLKTLVHQQDFWTLLERVGHKSLKNQQTQNELAYWRGYCDFEFFAQWFFPHYCKQPFSKMHLDFFRDEREPERKGRREVIAAPRGHAKTTMKLILKVIHAIVYETEPYILILCQSEAEAKDRVTQILNELVTNDRLIAVYGTLAPQSVKPGQKKTFITRSGIRVQAKSIGQQIRGLNFKGNRPTLVILDDVETLASAQSLPQREKMKNWFFKDVLKGGQTDGSTNYIVIGTCLHMDSLVSDLLEQPGWDSRRYQAILRFSSQETLWQKWRALLTDLSNPVRVETAQAFYRAHEIEMLEGTEVLWPEGDSYVSLMTQIVTEGLAAFNSEKQNQPYDPATQLFNMDKARRFHIDYAGKFLFWQNDPQHVVAFSELKQIIAFHDPALGSKPGSTSDYGAIVVVGQDNQGYFYVLDCYLAKSEPSLQIEAAFSLHQKWGLKALFVEENGFQQLLRHMYHDYQKQHGINSSLNLQGVQQTSNKVQRISTLEPDITNGHLLFATDLDPGFLRQMRLFPTDHDDGPDALHGAVFQLKQITSQKISHYGFRAQGYLRGSSR